MAAIQAITLVRHSVPGLSGVIAKFASVVFKSVIVLAVGPTVSFIFCDK